MEILRTPASRFQHLSDYSFAPRYAEVSYGAARLRMHYLDEGAATGQPVILFHGQAAWAYIYRAMVPPLAAAGFRVIVPDLIGFGRSDKLRDQSHFTLSAHVSLLSQLFEQLGLFAAHAFCHDWGGYFAMRLSVCKPGLLDHLILSNTGALVSDPAGRQWFEQWRERLLALAEFPISAMLQERSVRTLSPAELAGYDAPFPGEAYKAGPRRLPMIHPLVAAGEEAAHNARAWENMGRWDKPTLLLFSAQMARGSMTAEAFVDHVPGTAGPPHGVFDQASFFIQEDQAAELARRTIAFLQQQS